MKKSLKKSEIIENLHRVLTVDSCSPVFFSIIQIADFWCVYHLLVKCNRDNRSFLQVVSIELHFGWIQYTVHEGFNFDEISVSRLCYLKRLHELTDEYKDVFFDSH